jgi:hypothetical protein
MAIQAIDSAKAMGAPVFSTPRDLCGSNPRLKLGFVAQVFNAKLGLENEMEITAYGTFINHVLRDTSLVSRLLPLEVSSRDLFDRFGDGFILVALLNSLCLERVPSEEFRYVSQPDGSLSLPDKQFNVKLALEYAAKLKLPVALADAQGIVFGR